MHHKVGRKKCKVSGVQKTTDWQAYIWRGRGRKYDATLIELFNNNCDIVMIDWIKDQYSRADKKHIIAIGTGTIAVAALIGYFSVKNSKTRKIPTPESTTKPKPVSED